jgi:hypothetical protein
MTEDKIKELLASLKSAEDAHQALLWHRTKLREDVITPEQRQQLADIDAELHPQVVASAESIEALMETVRLAVIRLKKTVEDDVYQVMFVKPSIKWNTERLLGMAEDHPGIKNAMTEGAASARVGKKKPKVKAD